LFRSSDDEAVADEWNAFGLDMMENYPEQQLQDERKGYEAMTGLTDDRKMASYGSFSPDHEMDDDMDKVFGNMDTLPVDNHHSGVNIYSVDSVDNDAVMGSVANPAPDGRACSSSNMSLDDQLDFEI